MSWKNQILNLVNAQVQHLVSMLKCILSAPAAFPRVENAEEEEKQLKREEDENAQKVDLYQQAFKQQGKQEEEEGGEGDET